MEEEGGGEGEEESGERREGGNTQASHSILLACAMKCTHFILLPEAWEPCQSKPYVDVLCVLNYNFFFKYYFQSVHGWTSLPYLMVLVRHFRLLGSKGMEGTLARGEGGCLCPKINEAWSTDITEVVQDVFSRDIQLVIPLVGTNCDFMNQDPLSTHSITNTV